MSAAGRLRPAHPLPQMATFELAEFRESLEAALAMDELPSGYPPRRALQSQLDAVLEEQAEREQIRHG